jgi:large subunit ribosomal protein L31
MGLIKETIILILLFCILNILLSLHLFYKESITMKKDLHPKNYRLVVFKDMSNEYSFLTKSCIDTRESVKWEDGNEYPLVKLEISHTSHPFYTGKMKLVDTAGRIDKFRTRYNKK